MFLSIHHLLQYQNVSHSALTYVIYQYYIISIHLATNSSVLWMLLSSAPLQSPHFSSVAQSCPILHDPMNHSMPGLPVHHQLLESTQTHIPWVSDAIQSSHPRLSPSPPALNLFQHQGIVQWVSSSHQMAKVLEFSPSNEHSGLISFWMGWLDLLLSKGLSRIFSNTTVQKHQFFSTQLSLQSNSHIHPWLLEKP